MKLRIRTMAAVAMLVAVTGCRSNSTATGQESAIVQQVEAAGSGDVTEVPVQSLEHFFDGDVRLAVRIQAECTSAVQPGNAAWEISPEGKVCLAANQQNRTFQLNAYESMKATAEKSGDSYDVQRIEKMEGK